MCPIIFLLQLLHTCRRKYTLPRQPSGLWFLETGTYRTPALGARGNISTIDAGGHRLDISTVEVIHGLSWSL